MPLSIALLISFVAVPSYVNKSMELTNVVVFNSDLSKGIVITEKDVSTQKVPRSAVKKNMITDKKDVINKVLSVDAKKGMYAYDAMFVPDAASLDEIYTLPDNMYAYGLATDLTSSVGGLVKKGDIVDIIVFIDGKNSGKSVVYAPQMLSSLKILSVINNEGDNVEEKDSSKSQLEINQKKTPSVLVLQTNIEQAKLLSAYQNIGKVSVALRSRNTGVSYSVRGDTVQEIPSQFLEINNEPVQNTTSAGGQ